MRLTLATVGRAGAMEDADVSYLLELERLTRELWDHLTAMFVVEEVAELLREMAVPIGRLGLVSTAASIRRICSRR
jgi:hypothetical protein